MFNCQGVPPKYVREIRKFFSKFRGNPDTGGKRCNRFVGEKMLRFWEMAFQREIFQEINSYLVYNLKYNAKDHLKIMPLTIPIFRRAGSPVDR